MAATPAAGSPRPPRQRPGRHCLPVAVRRGARRPAARGGSILDGGGAGVTGACGAWATSNARNKARRDPVDSVYLPRGGTRRIPGGRPRSRAARRGLGARGMSIRTGVGRSGGRRGHRRRGPRGPPQRRAEVDTVYSRPDASLSGAAGAGAAARARRSPGSGRPPRCRRHSRRTSQDHPGRSGRCQPPARRRRRSRRRRCRRRWRW